MLWEVERGYDACVVRGPERGFRLERRVADQFGFVPVRAGGAAAEDQVDPGPQRRVGLFSAPGASGGVFDS